ncbi:MAG: metal-dependent transcriptional regulator [Chloroflexi bacterium]|nr:metal-dependent transcriptional regulator [Chloroflexota bacterium]
MRTERVEEYLEAICKRQETETPVPTSALAADLGVSLPAVTDMMHRLAEQGLIDYEHNKGASLTAEGNRAALTLIRRHRLWERFLTDILGLPWDKVHDEACRLEHATSPETESALAALLGEAETCPHGHPIPDKNGRIRDQALRPLSGIDVGQTVCISAVAIEEGRLLRRIEKWGLKPRSVAKIEKKSADGSLELSLEGHTLVMDRATSESLLARPLSPDEEAAEEEIPMSMLQTGETGILKSYTGGKDMLGRCLSMGFTPGSQVKMIENFRSGPVLVRVHDAEVALGRGMAAEITVTKKGLGC